MFLFIQKIRGWWRRSGRVPEKGDKRLVSIAQGQKKEAIATGRMSKNACSSCAYKGLEERRFRREKKRRTIDMTRRLEAEKKKLQS